MAKALSSHFTARSAKSELIPMENEFEHLDEQEQALIREHRKVQAQKKNVLEFRLKSLRVASKYEQWLQARGEGNAFSTFINDFGYQEPDGRLMWDHVTRILEAATLQTGNAIS